ncbi:MAG: Fis family transcriptional regulator [Acidobacteria bacterium]|jgi:formate hydrogenlyase transcriptional activator|nr:MAG: Fis family transcriptional regulator [Acidobacteriota bacterium]
MANAKALTNLQALPTSPPPAQSLSSDAVFDALKMILIGAPLNDVLSSVALLIEAQAEGAVCSIFLLDEDGQHLRYAAAPNLSDEYRIATDGVCIGPHVGSCGAAAYLRRAVFVSDVRSHPHFANFKDLIVLTGLRASWSSPIMSHDGRVLGTFGMFYREVREPGPAEIQMIDYASRIAGIAIERKRAEEKLRQDERELRQLIDFLPQHVLVLDTEGSLLQANQVLLDYNGHTLEEMQGAGSDERHKRDLHPDDLERARSERRCGLASGVPFEIEKRMRGKDGRYRWFLFRYNPLLNEQGRVARWFATATDIEDRKQTEQRVRNENLALREQIDRDSMFEDIVGSSEALRKVLRQVGKVARSDSTVLILGETGTGKELIARAIHKRSNRGERAFIGVNCAAIPASLIASELFGHEKGAFTGATQRRPGRFESANGGTIFLDEVGDLPPETQIALLRVLQEREIERVGSNKPIPVDVRVLAATHRDLNALVAEGKFRQDLLYRLNVVPIEMPSLRDRAPDIPLLVEYFIDRFGKKAGKKFRTIDRKTLKLFQAYGWPGNVRELQNVIERAVILSDGDTFSVDETWLKHEPLQLASPRAALNGALVRQEKEMIEGALAESHGRISGPTGAAANLGLPTRTLDSKIKRLGINKYRFKVPQAS